MSANISYMYLLSPLHTGGATQEGNQVGIARESHTNLPFVPSSTIRGKIRAIESDRVKQVRLFGPQLEDIQNADFVQRYEQATTKKLIQLEQGDIWIGDGSILWLPVSSLSHGVIWISSPMLLERWARFNKIDITTNEYKVDDYYTNLDITKPVYLKDAIISSGLKNWGDTWKKFVPQTSETISIKRVIVLPDKHCATLMQMGLWRQVKIKLDEHKTVNGGFRYEEAIPPDTLMYFPWGTTFQANGNGSQSLKDFQALIHANSLLQIGGQESLGRGFVEMWIN